MPTLRSRPCQQEDVYIPSERKSSLRSQVYPSTGSTSSRSSPTNHTNFTRARSRVSPSKKRRSQILNTDSEESDGDINPSPSKRGSANKAKQSYPSPPSSRDESEIPTISCSETRTIPRVVLVDLPLEIQQKIVDFLPNDDDVTRYSRVCRGLRVCVSPIIWQARFLRTFDNILGADPVKLQAQYKKRQGIARRHFSFEDSSLSNQKFCLEMLKDMVIESNAHVVRDEDNNEIISGLNHDYFFKYFQQEVIDGRIKGSNLLDNITDTFSKSTLKRGKTPGLALLKMVVKLCFIHIFLHPDICNIKTSIFHISQEQVYKCFTNAPLFLGRNKYEINLQWLLHAANFFKFHFKMPDGEGILAHMYRQLEKDELPTAWAGKLKSGTQRLSQHWKGAFTFLREDELELLRLGRLHCTPVDETTEGNNGFQDLTIFSDIKGSPLLGYPPEIDQWIDGSPSGEYIDKVSGERIMPEVQDFFGLGRSDVDYHLHGRLYGLPPQEGVPGFQRVSMLKYLPDVEGKYGTGRTSFWAYEGCVLPGNQIILGRWWCPVSVMDRGRSYCGPFIFWRVSGSAEDKMRTIDDALAFLDFVEKETIG